MGNLSDGRVKNANTVFPFQVIPWHANGAPPLMWNGVKDTRIFAIDAKP